MKTSTATAGRSPITRACGERLHLPPSRVRTLSLEGAVDAEGLEAVDGRWLPELTPDVKRKYKFDSRFLDDLNRVSWDTAFHLCRQRRDSHRDPLQR